MITAAEQIERLGDGLGLRRPLQEERRRRQAILAGVDRAQTEGRQEGLGVEGGGSFQELLGALVLAFGVAQHPAVDQALVVLGLDASTRRK